MVRRSLALAGAVFAAAIAAAPAGAATYDWSFTTSGASHDVIAEGTITTPGGVNVAGNVILISGEVNGLSISGLVPNPTPGSTALSPDGKFNYDNTLSPAAAPYLTFPGLLFTASDGTEYNIYWLNDSSEPSDGGYNLDAASNGNFGAFVDGQFAITGVVPEPAFWTMMLTGFFSLGFMLRAARKPVAA